MMSCCQTDLRPISDFSSLFLPSLFPVSLSLYPSIAPRLSLTYALCLVLPMSLALSPSCSVSHLYKELSAHSNSHSNESVWMKGRSHRPELMLLLHVRHVWNAEHLHTLEPQNKTLWQSSTVNVFGSDTLCVIWPSDHLYRSFTQWNQSRTYSTATAVAVTNTTTTCTTRYCRLLLQILLQQLIHSTFTQW